MAKKNNKPDKLAQEAAQAKAAGMSYGKWKAMQQPEVKPEIHDGYMRCKCGCGAIFKKRYNKMFESENCRRKYNKGRKAYEKEA